MRQSSSRRKACDHCVKAKRRCDGRQPCMTCVRKKVDCSVGKAHEVGSSTSSIPLVRTTGYGDAEDSLSNSWSFPSEGEALNELYFEPPTMNYILPPFTLAQLAPFRLQKCVQRLQSCVASMAQEAGTPFLKVGSPECSDQKSRTNVFLACRAYQSRTRHNKLTVHKALAHGFVMLVGNLKHTVSFREQLCLLQAIILYQIMFYFGDDGKLRTLADDHAEVIQRSVWLFQQSYISELVFPSTSVGCNAVEISYDRWLLLESARRTILGHLFVKGIYGHLQNGYCDIVPALAELPLSIEGDLWQAVNEDAWTKSLQQSPRALDSSVMPYGEAVAFWLANDCPNMDDFHHLIYEACHDLRPASI